MQEPTWIKITIDFLAIFGGFGGFYSIYKIVKARKEEKIDKERVNQLIKGDMLPASMEDKRIKPNEYLLVSINNLNRELRECFNNLSVTIKESTGGLKSALEKRNQ